MHQLWFEFDLDAEADAPEPSIFALLRGASPVDGAAEVVRALGAPPPPVLDRIAAAAPPGARLNHVGVMRGRPGAGVRLGLGGIRLAGLAPFLLAIGWPGDVAAADALARGLLDRVDRVVVNLDLLEGGLLARIGLESYFDRREALDPRWPGLLDHLVVLGVADAGKAEALLRWPGITTPVDVDAWPDDLVVRDLAEREPGAVERRLSHVKLTWSPAGLEAKAYFGWGSVRLRDAEPSERPRRPLRPAADVPAALDAAVRFLLSGRNQGGWWRDFFDRARPPEADRRVTGYASDEWVTAYVANVLATAPDPGARAAAADALELLLPRARPGGGWGYHALLPADADTTSWVLRLARALGRDDEALARGLAFVRARTGPDGGVATYPPSAAEQLATFLGMPGPYDGWCAPHTCVTAAAAVLDPAPRAHVAARQRADGSWPGHWWDDDEYATARAVEALAPFPEHAGAVDRARRWAHERLDEERSPFATALALQVTGPEPRGLERLLRTQRDDGSWEPSARLRVPAPAAVDPLADPATTLTYVDDDAFFTTATVVAALLGA